MKKKSNTWDKNIQQPTNVKLGKHIEQRVCEVFKQYGFFAHNCVNALLGQPCDIIAIHGQLVVLIDCKHIERGTRFDFKNIQDNQYLCFKYSKDYNNITNTGFVIYCEETNILYYLPFNLVVANGDYKKVSIDCTQLPLFKDKMNEWRKIYESFDRGENRDNGLY